MSLRSYWLGRLNIVHEDDIPVFKMRLTSGQEHLIQTLLDKLKNEPQRLILYDAGPTVFYHVMRKRI